MLYSLDEICLIPATKTSIKHRIDVKVNYDNGMLPIFTAPMACIVDSGNYLQFVNKGINTIIPRSVHWDTRIELARTGNWIAVGLSEAKYIYESTELVNMFTYKNPLKICIDQANGHMRELIDLCKDIKNRFGQQVIIMTGNIANPHTYDEYALAGVDYVRVGIGGGSRCMVEGTKIKTVNGNKNIEKIKPGDNVLTINGEKQVKNIFTNTTDILININNEIKCTPNHKFLVIKKCDKHLVTDNNINEYSFYIEAKDLNSEYLLVKV